MAGMIAAAIGALFKENEAIVAPARILGGVAACRIHRIEEARDVLTGSAVVRWQIEFRTQEDALAFEGALREIVDAVVGEE